MYSLLKTVCNTIYSNIIYYIFPIKVIKKPIPKNIRHLVWSKYHNNNKEGKCYACDGYINSLNWHCSHVISDKKGGLAIINNLRPCCQHCNLSCGKQNLYAYIRDKKLKGAGNINISSYMKKHPSESNSKRI